MGNTYTYKDYYYYYYRTLLFLFLLLSIYCVKRFTTYYFYQSVSDFCMQYIVLI